MTDDAGVTIQLTWPEVVRGADVGCQRHVRALAARRQHAHGSPDPAQLWSVDVEGALAEQVVAKYLRAYWQPSVERDKHTGDVAGYHVRWTRHVDNGHLCLHDADPVGVFVLVLGQAPTYIVRGWIRTDDGRRDEWWREAKPGSGRLAYWVPQTALRSMAELPPAAAEWAGAA